MAERLTRLLTVRESMHSEPILILVILLVFFAIVIPVGARFVDKMINRARDRVV